MNALTGLGGTKDKRNAAEYQRSRALTDPELDNLYHNNDLAATICDTIPEESLRQGFELKITEDDPADPADPVDPSRTDSDDLMALKTKVMARCDELGVKTKLLDAAIWGNVFGAGAVLLGVDDRKDVGTPLQFRPGVKVKFLTVLDRRDLTPMTWYANALEPKYGLPETYSFVNSLAGKDRTGNAQPIQAIHESRLLFFYGARTSKRRVAENKGWPLSRLQKVYDVLRDFDMGFASASYLLQESSQAVYGVKDLLSILTADGGKEILEKRMEVIDMSRSVAKALIIDAEHETFERKPVSFQGVPDVLDRLANRLSAAARMPVTILMGEAPTGLSATGDADMRKFYDRVQIFQTDVMKPALEVIVRILLLEQGTEPDSWCVEFPSLYQQTEAEIADTRLKVAQADKIYNEMGAVFPEEIAMSRFGSEGWSMETTIDQGMRAELLKHSQNNALETAKDPEPTPGESAKNASDLAKVAREKGVA